ncbi:MAG: ATP-binding protein [Thermoprotei archaeon]
MYFNPEPKERRKDLYDFEEELSDFVGFLKDFKIIVVKGLRRTGKTSLVKTGLNESGLPYIYFDTRFSENPRYVDFVNVIKAGLEGFVKKNRFAFSVSGIRISLSPPSVEIRWRENKKRFSLYSLFSALDEVGEKRGVPIIVAFDEAQELRKIKCIDFKRVFASVYDNLKHVRIVLTGSEVGLLDDFLDLESVRSPLYGRLVAEISTKRLGGEQAFDFLRRGFTQHNIKVDMGELGEAVGFLDGIIGWLTYYGYARVKLGKAPQEVFEMATELSLSELEKFLGNRRSNKHKTLLSALKKERGWAEAKRFVEEASGETIDDKNFTKLLHTLVDRGFVVKTNGKYVVSDPVVRRAIDRVK